MEVTNKNLTFATVLNLFIHRLMTIISSTTAATYESNWATYVNGNTDMRPVFLTGGSLITGVSMNYADYKYLIGNVGVIGYQVRFGLDGTDLHIMVTGYDVEDLVCTPIYDFTSYTTTQHSSANFAYNGFVPNVVAPVVIKDWLNDWESQGSTIPSDWFKIFGTVLKGYHVEPGDFYNLLLEHTNASNSNIYIAFNKRTFNSGTNDANVSVAMYAENSQKSTVYALNFCLPCPKTCGGWRERKK